MIRITSHVLDGVTGRHAAGVVVSLQDREGQVIVEKCTDAGGRVALDVPPEQISVGVEYHLHFWIAEYLASLAGHIFRSERVLERVIVPLRICCPDDCLHAPLIISHNSCTFWYSGD